MKKNLFKLSSLLIIFTAVILFFMPKLPAQAVTYSLKINVTSKDYGAKAGTDSTKAIQKALDEAAKKGTKKRPALVTIPKGTYYLSKPLVIGSNTVLSLNKRTIMKKTGNPLPLYMLMTNPGKKGGYRESQNITVKGGVWDAEYKKYSELWGGTHFFFVHCYNIKFSNIEFKNNYATHFIEFGGVDKVTVSGCKFHGFKYHSEKEIKECIQLDVNHDSDMMSAAGVFDDTSCNNVTIKNCEFYDYARAIGSHIAVDGVYHQNITITGNYFHDLDREPIYGYNYANCTISDNTFERNGGGITIRNNDTGSAGSVIKRLPGIPATKIKNNDYNLNIVSNSILINKANTGSSSTFEKIKGIYLSGGEGDVMKNVVISDNIIVADTVGIHLRYIENATIESNTIDRNNSAYDVLKTTYSEEGIMLENSEATIIDTAISSNSTSCYVNGIGVHDSSSATIKGVELPRVEKKGISANSGGKVTISGTTISGCKADYGLFVAANTDVSISNSVIEKSGKSGIYCESAKLACKNCEIKNNEKSGFTLLGSHIELDGNTVTGNKQRSITITSACNGFIKNNTFCSPDTSLEVLLSGSDKLDPVISQINKKTITSYGGYYTDFAGNCFKTP